MKLNISLYSFVMGFRTCYPNIGTWAFEETAEAESRKVTFPSPFSPMQLIKEVSDLPVT